MEEVCVMGETMANHAQLMKNARGASSDALRTLIARLARERESLTEMNLFLLKEDRGVTNSVSSTSAKTPFPVKRPASRTPGVPRGCAKMECVRKAKLAAVVAITVAGAMAISDNPTSVGQNIV